MACALGFSSASGRSAFLLAAVLTIAGCASISPAIDQAETEDATVRAAVKSALVETLGGDVGAVSVKAEENTLTIGGFVASEAQRDEALTAARRVAGDEGIVDAMQVR